MSLEQAILDAAKTPVKFSEILAAVGEQEGYLLGITVTKMVVDGRLQYKESKPYSKSWPVYCAGPFPKKFRMDPRNPNAKQEKGEDDGD